MKVVPLFKHHWSWFPPWLVPQLLQQGEALHLGENYWFYICDLFLMFHMEQKALECSIEKQEWVYEELERFSEMLWNHSHFPEHIGSFHLVPLYTAEELWSLSQD